MDSDGPKGWFPWGKLNRDMGEFGFGLSSRTVNRQDSESEGSGQADLDGPKGWLSWDRSKRDLNEFGLFSRTVIMHQLFHCAVH